METWGASATALRTMIPVALEPRGGRLLLPIQGRPPRWEGRDDAGTGGGGAATGEAPLPGIFLHAPTRHRRLLAPPVMLTSFVIAPRETAPRNLTEVPRRFPIETPSLDVPCGHRRVVVFFSCRLGRPSLESAWAVWLAPLCVSDSPGDAAPPPWYGARSIGPRHHPALGAGAMPLGPSAASRPASCETSGRVAPALRRGAAALGPPAPARLPSAYDHCTRMVRPHPSPRSPFPKAHCDGMASPTEPCFGHAGVAHTVLQRHLGLQRAPLGARHLRRRHAYIGHLFWTGRVREMGG